MISIVPASAADTELLSRIGGQTIFESHGRSAPAQVMQAYVDEKFSLAALESELSDTRNIFHIINYNGQPAGYSKVMLNKPIDPVPVPHITKLERLYLLQEFYDLKLGHRLLQYNIDRTKLAGQAGMWLYVWKGNDRALRFYERAGFQVVGDGWFRLTAEHANPNWQMYLGY